MTKDILEDAARRAASYLQSLAERPVAASAAAVAGLDVLDEALPEQPTDPARVLAMLDSAAPPRSHSSSPRCWCS